MEGANEGGGYLHVHVHENQVCTPERMHIHHVMPL